MPLIKDGRLAADMWIAVADDVALPATGPVIVSLERFRSERETLLERGEPLGVRLHSDQLAREIGDDAKHLAVIAIDFPSFRDGRAYSTARLLRERYGFAGELRAVGNVLRDQFLFMQRCGFDAFEVANETAVVDWRKAMAEFTVFYQAANDGRTPARTLRGLRRAAE
jgi:uncharacterized protein (DUF934 family)